MPGCLNLLPQHFNFLFTPGEGTGPGGGELSGLIKDMGYTPKECLYVGQAGTGIEGAAKLGMRVIKAEADQATTVRSLEEACETSL